MLRYSFISFLCDIMGYLNHIKMHLRHYRYLTISIRYDSTFRVITIVLDCVKYGLGHRGMIYRTHVGEIYLRLRSGTITQSSDVDRPKQPYLTIVHRYIDYLHLSFLQCRPPYTKRKDSSHQSNPWLEIVAFTTSSPYEFRREDQMTVTRS